MRTMGSASKHGRAITKGGGLTQREVVAYDVHELIDQPDLQRFWQIDARYERLADECRAILGYAGLPVRSAAYVVRHDIEDPRDAWFVLTDQTFDHVHAFRANGIGHTLLWGLYDGGAPMDSPVWLAKQVLTRINQLMSPHLGFNLDHITEDEQREMTRYLGHRRDAIIHAIGELKERLFWKWAHEPAAQRAYAADEARRAGAREGARVNRTSKDARKNLVLGGLEEHCTADERRTLSNAELARRFLAHALSERQEEWTATVVGAETLVSRRACVSQRLIERYVSELRRAGLLPPREKNQPFMPAAEETA